MSYLKWTNKSTRVMAGDRLALTHVRKVNLIGGTTTKSGLNVKAVLFTTQYEPGQKIGDAEMQKLRPRPHTFHGDWNYTVQPRSNW